MSINAALRSHLLNALLGRRNRRHMRWLHETRRRLLGRPHVVSVFLQLDDPYSYLLAHYLPRLKEHFRIELRLYLSEAQAGGYQPAPEMLAEYAIKDCERLARELAIPFLDKGPTPPAENRRAMLDAIAACKTTDDLNEELLQALSVYWRGDAEAAARRAAGVKSKGAADSMINASQRLQKRLGHYNSATLHYAGEWYWGVDRLHYLLERLREVAAARSDVLHPTLASIGQALQVMLPLVPPATAAALPPIELFHSVRSPYSYLVLRRACDVADAFGVRLVLRPVLPMVMRGMQVPKKKLLYIAKDAAREAERLGIPFGKVVDPVGRGAERCLAVFQLAQLQNRGRDFLINAGEAIWSRAVNVASDIGLQTVTDETGLSWPDVELAIENDDWREPIEQNRESMMASGSWGVPTLRMGEFVVWGQDRVWMLVRHIEELCGTGDGTMVSCPKNS